MDYNYRKNKLYASVIKHIRRTYGRSFADEIINKSNREYQRMQQIVGDVPKEHRKHVNAIIERAALYTVLKEKFPEDAYEMVCEPLHTRNYKTNRMIAKVTRREPGARFFLRMMYVMGDTVFNEKAGHIKRWRIREKTCAAFDMLECPYVSYLNLLGLPELARSFCDDDIEVFSKLPNIKYTRPETLGLGGAKCDFRMELDMGKETIRWIEEVW